VDNTFPAEQQTKCRTGLYHHPNQCQPDQILDHKISLAAKNPKNSPSEVTNASVNSEKSSIRKSGECPRDSDLFKNQHLAKTVKNR